MRYFNRKTKNVRLKRDLTPVTDADKEASRFISEKLLQGGINVISEEEKLPDYEIRKTWEKLWIIDPVDGTKEFIRGGNDFTVNIALITGNTVTLGVIFIPVAGELYYGLKGLGAFKQFIQPDGLDNNILAGKFRIFPEKDEERITVVTSKSHANHKTNRFIKKILKEYPTAKVTRRGSSLKYCLVAEGRATVFPRLSVINEWDTAAGQAIAEAAGCVVMQPDGISSVLYNKKILVTPENIVASSKRIMKKIL